MKRISLQVFLLLLVLTDGFSYLIRSAAPEPSRENLPAIIATGSRADTTQEAAGKDSAGDEGRSSVSLVSWNIQHLGRTKTEAEIGAIAQILRGYDIVALQEVVAKDPAGAQAVARLADALNRTGFQWDYQVSDPTRSSSPYIRERYAFLWKPSRVRQVGRASLDRELQDVVEREPFIASFRRRGEDAVFHVINFHSRPYNQQPEKEIIHFLTYPQRFGSDRVLLAGDFNLDERHSVWEPFYELGMKSALKNSPTTLKRKCMESQYLNHAIDNIYFYPGIRKTAAETIDFVGTCENLEQARRISDHLPVFMVFTTDTLSARDPHISPVSN